LITFQLTPANNGNTTATTGDLSATGCEPCRGLARLLVDAGERDQPWQMVRNGTPVMRGRSVHWLAASTLSEGGTGFVRGWWQRHPSGNPRPILEAVVEAQKALAKQSADCARLLAADRKAAASGQRQQARKPVAVGRHTASRAELVVA
jgi:hypothetical protein